MTTPREIKRADALIRFFEEQGREVSGVTILRDGSIKVDFANTTATASNHADLVTM